MSKLLDVQNVTVIFGSASTFGLIEDAHSLLRNVSVSCDFDGARYHVWMDWSTGEIKKGISKGTREKPVLYKNPPSSARSRYDKGYFPTRYLDAEAKHPKAIIDTMLAVVKRDGLIARELQVLDEKRKQEEERRRLHAKKLAKQQAAEEMYDALVRIAPHLPTVEDMLNHAATNDGRAGEYHLAADKVRAAIKAADTIPENKP